MTLFGIGYLMNRNNEFDRVLSLTPNFSWVSGPPVGRDRFNGLGITEI